MSKETRAEQNEIALNKLNALKQSYRDIQTTEAMKENLEFLKSFEEDLIKRAGDSVNAEECLALTQRAFGVRVSREHIERLSQQP